MIIAGEASGDLHGSNLIHAAAKKYPALSFYGVGGRQMKAAGCELLFSADELSVMGALEVVGQLPKIVRRFRLLKSYLTGQNPPGLLLLIDFPDFNLRLARVAKKIGIPVLYFITPKVWAWRSKRARTIVENTDRLAVIFPFETEIYERLGAKVDYVGNPLLDEFYSHPPAGNLRQSLGIDDNAQVIGLFPGSRQSELTYIFDTLVETARQIYRQKPEVKFLLPVAPSLPAEEFRNRLGESHLPVFILEENIYEVASACDAVLTVSGTVTLQLALAGTPMAIIYKMAPLSYEIGKRLVKIGYVGLTNIVAGKGIVREFIQNAANPEALSAEMIRLLDDRNYAESMRSELEQVRRYMGDRGCSERVADIAARMVAVHNFSEAGEQNLC